VLFVNETSMITSSLASKDKTGFANVNVFLTVKLAISFLPVYSVGGFVTFLSLINLSAVASSF
jgi:hypothetical protein